MAAAVVTLMIRMCFSVYTMLSERGRGGGGGREERGGRGGGGGESCPYGYRRVWALLRRQAELDGMPAINAKRVYRIMRQNALLLEGKPAVPPSKRAIRQSGVKESNQRWCSDGFEFCCDNGEETACHVRAGLRDREALHWAVTTGGFNSETVQDVMLGAVERALRQRASGVSSGVVDGKAAAEWPEHGRPGGGLNRRARRAEPERTA